MVNSFRKVLMTELDILALKLFFPLDLQINCLGAFLGFEFEG